MANWTYLNLEFPWNNLTERQAALNVQGALGWELISISDSRGVGTTTYTSRATFKKTI